MKSSVKHWYNKLPEIGYQMKPYVKGGKALLPSRGKGNYAADLYFGRGVKFNGTDQNILIPDVVTPADTMFFTMESGRLNSLIFNCWFGRYTVTDKIGINYYDDNATYKTYSVKNSENKKNFCFSFDRTTLVISFYGEGELIDTLQIVAPYHTSMGKEIGTRIGGGYIAGITSNLIYMKGNLQPHEIMYQYTNPEKFLYHEKQSDGTFIAKSEILSQSQVDNVVANFPMCETDGYVRNMIGYSEGADVINFPLANWTIYNDSGDSSVTEDANGNIVFDYVAADNIFLYIEQLGTPTNVPIKVTITVESISGIFKIQDGDTNDSFGYISEAGTYEIVGSSNQQDVIIARASADVDTNAVISSFTVQELTATYPIQNFTTSCRDEAKNLQTGLQTCFWKRDVLGVPVGSSFDEITFHSVEDRAVTKNVSMANVTAIEYVYVNSINKYNYNRLFSIYKDDGTLVLEMQRLDTNDQLYLKVNTQNTGNYVSLLPVTHVVYEFDITDNTVSMFQNGVKVGDTVSITDPLILDPATLYLGNSNYLTRGITGAFRLFNIHTTPQDPAKLYADAVKKGLLS